jgi:hypothetical protein
MMDDDECGAVGGMIGRGNRSTWRKPAPVPPCPPDPGLGSLTKPELRHGRPYELSPQLAARPVIA